MVKESKGLSAKIGVQEVDFKSFLCLMIVLIPILLITAEFAKVSIIDIEVSKQGVNHGIKDKNTEPSNQNENKLKLTPLVTDSVITIGAKNNFLPSITYREFHEYKANDDNYTFSVEYTPQKKVLHPITRRPMKDTEQGDIVLYATDTTHNIINAYYTNTNELLTDVNGRVIKNITLGDTAYTVSNPQKMILINNKNNFVKKALSVYDLLKSKLFCIKQAHPHVKDSKSIVIAAENSIKYDKIIQLMDVARATKYNDISIAKLRDT